MRKIFLLLLICFLGSIGFGQEMPEDSLERMLEAAKAYYNNGEYENAIIELEKAMQYLKQLNQTDQVEAYKYLAFSYVAFGNKEKAKEHFKLALTLDPDLELDPAIVSPKIIQVFEEAKSEMVKTPPVKPPDVKPVKPPTTGARVSTFGATWRSCCFPGWGQIYKGQSGKGKKIMILGVTTGSLLLGSALMREAKHNDYLDADPHDPDAIEEAYDSYALWHNITGVNLALFLGVYIYNVYDVVTSKPVVGNSLLQQHEGLYYALSGDRVVVGWKAKF